MNHHERQQDDGWLHGASDRESNDLREGWTALGQLLAAATPALDEQRLLGAVRRRIAQRRAKRVWGGLALAASLALVCTAGWMWLRGKGNDADLASADLASYKKQAIEPPQAVSTGNGMPTADGMSTMNQLEPNASVAGSIPSLESVAGGPSAGGPSAGGPSVGGPSVGGWDDATLDEEMADMHESVQWVRYRWLQPVDDLVLFQHQIDTFEEVLKEANL